jgi:hypothetical protein
LVRDGQHGAAEIAADGVRPCPVERFGEVAGAATDVKRPFALEDSGQTQHAALPKAMQAEALKVIDQIIARGNAVEERANTGAAFGAGLIISI